jgi:hypothetical protein
VGGARAGVVGVGRGPRRHGRRRWGSEGGGGGGSVEEGRGGRRVGEWEGRRQEAKGRGRQWNSVWDPFIQSKHNFIHPSADERSKMIGLFGPKRANYICPLLNFFLFLFSFLCNKKIIKLELCVPPTGPEIFF